MHDGIGWERPMLPRALIGAAFVCPWARRTLAAPLLPTTGAAASRRLGDCISELSPMTKDVGCGRCTANVGQQPTTN